MYPPPDHASATPFAWHELRVPDLDEGARFYGALLGWTFEANAMGRAIRLDDLTIGGMSEVKPGLPTHWTPYLRCSDVDAVAAAAREAGGIVTSGEPADVPEIGRLAPILDPDKSIFAAFTPESGTEVRSPFGWERLRTPDPAAAVAFYGTVLGWHATLAPDGSGGVFEHSDGTRFADVVQATQGESTGWLPFVHVDRLTEARALVVDLGGSADHESLLANLGRYARVTDSQAVEFALLQGA